MAKTSGNKGSSERQAQTSRSRHVRSSQATRGDDRRQHHFSGASGAASRSSTLGGAQAAGQHPQDVSFAPDDAGRTNPSSARPTHHRGPAPHLSGLPVEPQYDAYHVHRGSAPHHSGLPVEPQYDAYHVHREDHPSGAIEGYQLGTQAVGYMSPVDEARQPLGHPDAWSRMARNGSFGTDDTLGFDERLVPTYQLQGPGDDQHLNPWRNDDSQPTHDSLWAPGFPRGENEHYVLWRQLSEAGVPGFSLEGSDVQGHDLPVQDYDNDQRDVTSWQH